MNISDVRKKFPQYQDLSDDQLADALHRKFYSDMPAEKFRASIGMSAPEASLGEKVGAVARAGWEGITGPARFAEQVIGKMGIPVVSEAARSSADERGRALEQAKKTAPGWATSANIVGSIMSPPSVAAMGAFPASGAPSVIRSALQGAGQGGLFGAMQPVENQDDMLSEKWRQLMWGAGGGAAGGAIAGKAQQVVANRAAQGVTKATQDAVAKLSREAGYTIPPATTNPSMTNSVIEGLSGKIKTAQQASIKNQSVTNDLVRKALGMADDAPITKEALAGLRKNAGVAYEAVKRAPGPFVADDAFNAAVADIQQKATGMASEFPSLVNKDAAPLIDDLMRGQWSPEYAVEATKRLREAARNTLSSPAATDEAKQLAAVQKDAARALEDLIARNLDKAGLKDLHGAWQAARTEIAKIMNVNKAVNDTTGNVIAKKLTQQMERGSPLTGELRTVARSAAAFPKAMQEVTESMPALSPLDFAAALIGTAGTGNMAGTIGLLARPAARSLLLSPSYQRLMGAPSYGPGVAGLIAKSHPAITGAAGLLTLGAD